ncbi:MAG: DUF3108 domain-containing protein [Thiomicrorhabdus sp.]|nr:DUF3108 domain-containing protein [Thiomicrorhabdus sp.]MCF6298395.1 DUF3108 domain-containing protein [Thiomicrorhabdus sp.]
MSYSLFKKSLYVGLIFYTALYTTASLANTLPNFKSSYYVNAFGVELGKATHQFNCQQENCTLISRAKPSGLAAMFFSDSSIETIQLKQTKNTLTWLSYHKLGISKKDGKKVQKHTTLKRDTENDQVVFIEKNRTWSAQPNTFDIMSIPYAIQYFKLNNRALKTLEFSIQDSNFQEKLSFTTIDQPENLSFKFSNRAFKALKYVFESQQFKMELWLLPKYQYFPAKIRLINKKEDKIITLNLAELPKTL